MSSLSDPTHPIWQPNHPIWKMLRIVVVGATLLFFLTFMYKNGFTTQDLITMTGALSALAGYDTLKSSITKQKPEDGQDS